MPTTYRVALVSFAAAITLGLGGCARVSSPAVGGATFMDAGPRVIRFDNWERDYVHVYLIADKRQWLLGRVEPGAVAALQIPPEALTEGSTFVRLAVLTGGRLTLQAARDPRAKLTVAQPASALLRQQWAFSQGALTSLPR